MIFKSSFRWAGLLFVCAVFLFGQQGVGHAQGVCDPSRAGVNQLVGCLWDGTSPGAGSPVGAAESGPTLSSPVPSTAIALEKNWNNGGPAGFSGSGAGQVGTDNFAAQWKGTYTFAPGSYVFTGGSDDGMRVTVNGVRKIDKLIPRAYTEDSFGMTFCSATQVTFQVDYFEGGGGAKIKFGWAPGGGSNNQMTGCVWKGTDPATGVAAGFAPAGPIISSPVPASAVALDFDFGNGGPIGAPEVGTDNFSIKWTGTYIFPVGTYRFYAGSDDGIRVKINGTTIIDKLVDRGFITDFAEQSFSSETPVTVEIQYYDKAGGAKVKFGWTVPVTCTNQGGIDQMTGCFYVGTVPGSGASGGNADSGPTATSPAQGTFTALDKSWNASPNQVLGPDNFSARWKGTYTFAPGTYRFTVGSDDGVLVKMNGATKVSKLVDRGYTEDSFTADFTSQTVVTFDIDYYEKAGGARIKFGWSSAPSCVNAGRVGVNQMVGCFYLDQAFHLEGGDANIAPAATTVPAPTSFNALNKDWGAGAASSFLGADNFYARWQGTFTFAPGTYRFIAGSDDGIRVKMNNTTKIDKWVNRGYTEDSFVQTFDTQTTATFIVDYYEAAGGAKVRFGWDIVPTCSSSGIGSNRLIGCLWDWQSGAVPSDPTIGLSGGNAPAGPVASSPAQSSFTAIDQDWKSAGPAFVGSDAFSARWQGTYTFNPGTYRFIAGSDDGMRVKLNGVTVIDKWVNRGYTEDSFVQTFCTQTPVVVSIDYFENGGGARAKFGWVLDSVNGSANRFTGCIWNGTTFSGVSVGEALPGNTLPSPVPAQGMGLNFDFGNEDPGVPGVGRDNFSMIWKANLTFAPGTYLFTAGSDDGIRVKMGGVTKIDQLVDRGYAENTFPMTFGGPNNTTVPIEIQYYDKAGGASVQFKWAP